MIGLLVACGDPISNTFVTDDLVFLQALPESDLLSSPLALPEAATAPTVVGALAATDAFEAHTAAWRAVDQALRTPGTLDLREDDAREWRDVQVVYADGEQLETRTIDARIARSYGDGGEVYDWTIDSDAPVASGRSAGPLHEARWSLGDGTALALRPAGRFDDDLVSIERLGASDALLGIWFTDGAGKFGFGGALPIREGGAPILAVVVLEHDATGGRSGGLTFDDDGACGAWHGCWDAAGAERYRAGDHVATVGVASACPHPPVDLDTIRGSCP